MDKDQINKLISSGTYKGLLLNGKLIETHISWVILTKKYVFKIKKKMQYSFLNFSSLAKRKFYCERELVLNSRYSDIYLDVVPIKRDGAKLFIGTEQGFVLDYAVRMKRLQTAKQMNHLIKKNKVSKKQIDILAKKIAIFHRDAEVIYKPNNKTGAKNIFNDILSIVAWVKINLGSYYTDIIKRTVRNSDTFLDQNEKFIKIRIEDGFYRDGHGDLHSKNIFLYRDPIIFDCIEFNDSFRQIDVLNEVAFFCMDLEALGRVDLSEQFMKAYLEIFPCMKSEKEENLFTYYKCYRANVRAKVNILRAIQSVDKIKVKNYIIEIKTYLKLMDHYNDKYQTG
jgi:aminoglycoside phosphotransferase family enzyme